MRIKEKIYYQFDLFCKHRFLKTISKEVDKLEKLNQKRRSQIYIINELIKKYSELYGINLRQPTKKANTKSLYEYLERTKKARQSHFKEG